MMSALWLKTLYRWIHHTKVSSYLMKCLLQILLSCTNNSVSVYLLTLFTFCLYRRCTGLPDVGDWDIPDFHDDWEDTDQMRRMEDHRSSWWWAPFCQWAERSPHVIVFIIWAFLFIKCIQTQNVFLTCFSVSQGRTPLCLWCSWSSWERKSTSQTSHEDPADHWPSLSTLLSVLPGTNFIQISVYNSSLWWCLTY